MKGPLKEQRTVWSEARQRWGKVGEPLHSGAKRRATAGERHARAEYANNLFKSLCSPLQSADRFRAGRLGPDE